MMAHALVTVIAPLDRARLAEAEERIESLGNPAGIGLRTALDRLDGEEGTHFCSLHAITSKEHGKAYLAFEFSADGTPDEATARVSRAVGSQLTVVFSLASDWKAQTDICAYLTEHRIRVGVGLFDNAGLVFTGTPGMTVGRIRDEHRLAVRAAELLAGLDPTTPALRRLEAVRGLIAPDPSLADMLETAPSTPPFVPADTVALIFGLAASFIRTYLWPLVVLAAAGGLWSARVASGFWAWIGAALPSAAAWLFWSVVVAAIAAGALYWRLRSLESRDSVDDRPPGRCELEALFARENRCLQNHMVSVTQRKPGLVRWLTARLGFWIIGQLAVRQFRPGFLGDIGSIHFARWVTVPGTRDLVFFSNYDSSWESYLEDFITLAHSGLTAVWSNCIGFPRTRNLAQLGATDGERFKRFARRSMVPTRFWYSAYPDLSTVAVRTNAVIRQGLSGALTEDEAVVWMSLFGSAARPAETLVSSEIQSLMFGGLGKAMPFGTCLLHDLPDGAGEARAWLADVLPHVAFGDGRRLRRKAVITLALGPAGLRKLGLPEEGLRSFPYAYLSGMTHSERARALGDTGDNALSEWRWGTTTPDAVLLVYGAAEGDVDLLKAELHKFAAARGIGQVHRVPLKKVEPGQREPFGYADGISQPVIRGTYKGRKATNPIHLVEPGEFVLGYPDNRGNTPPGPVLPATADPRNMLPLVQAPTGFTRTVVDGMRDLGRNGSFLVIRELEQNVDKFHSYCRAEELRLKGSLPEPYEVTAEFIGAKLVGRWKNGSSIARHPYQPKNDEPGAAATEHEGEHAKPPSAAKLRRLRDNDFLFGAEDPEALHCPFGAHVRRANPRDSLNPGSEDQIGISNRHRIIRIGRQYQPETGSRPGLFFMCLNADIERQFEFVQQTWLRSPSFHGLRGERDPLLGEGDAGTCGFTIPTRYGPVQLSPVPAMVAVRGGGYFFLPGKRLLDFLLVPP